MRRHVRWLLAAALAALAVLRPGLGFGQTNDRTTTYGTVHDPGFDALSGATAEYGFYDGGAYRMEVPANWNGGLVLFAHGYRGDSADIVVSDSPLRQSSREAISTWPPIDWPCRMVHVGAPCSWTKRSRRARVSSTPQSGR
jgi:hypothetical protein